MQSSAHTVSSLAPTAENCVSRPHSHAMPVYNTRYATVEECKAACQTEVVGCDAINYSKYVSSKP